MPSNPKGTGPEELNAEDGRRQEGSWTDTKLFSPGGAAVILATGAGLVKVMDWRTKLKLAAQQKKHEQDLFDTDRDSYDRGWYSGKWLTAMDICLAQQVIQKGGDSLAVRITDPAVRQEELAMNSLKVEVLPESKREEIWQWCRIQYGLSKDPEWAWGGMKARTVLAGQESRQATQKFNREFKESWREMTGRSDPNPQKDQQDPSGNSLNSITEPIRHAGKTFLANAGSQLAATASSWKQRAPAQLQRAGTQMYQAARSRAMRPA